MSSFFSTTRYLASVSTFTSRFPHPSPSIRITRKIHEVPISLHSEAFTIPLLLFGVRSRLFCFFLHARSVLYCSVLYCSVLFCSVMYHYPTKLHNRAALSTHTYTRTLAVGAPHTRLSYCSLSFASLALSIQRRRSCNSIWG
jgi:hypothetical protein